MTLPNVRDVVPHSGRMVLIDRVIAADGESLTAEVTIRADALFAGANGVGAWVGVEYMAQTIAAYAGARALQRAEKAKIGVLVGTRQYSCNVPYFPLGATLQIVARRDADSDDHLESFVCCITGDGIKADAAVTVFQPDDIGLLIGQGTA
jgi:predicted hotdog family 3-hydroxylacyl-ACP dehydratase